MARTKRKDPIDVTPPFKAFVVNIGGPTVIEDTRTPEEIRKAHMDKKKTFKPGRKAKGWLHKGQKAKAKMALKTAKDFDDAVIPDPPKSDVWRFN